MEASTPNPDTYTERFYREWIKPHEDLTRFRVTLEQSDLEIFFSRAPPTAGARRADDQPLVTQATAALRRARRELKRTLRADPDLVAALTPRDLDRDAADIVRRMAAAAARWDVGPMAGVAGAVAGEVGRALEPLCETVIVENGGDVFAVAPRPVLFRLYAGEGSPFSSRIGFEVDASQGVGVCTSSGAVGPSLSLGRADAVVAIADDPAEADVAATALANRIHAPGDVGAVVDEERSRGRLRGLVACAGNTIGFWGDLKLRRLHRSDGRKPSAPQG